MSYEPNVWVTGNRITAEKLNHMEEGISSASGGGTPLIANLQASSNSLDRTWQEIYDALANGTPAYVKYGYNDEDGTKAELSPIVMARIYEGIYEVHSIVLSDDTVTSSAYGVNSANGYPRGRG